MGRGATDRVSSSSSSSSLPTCGRDEAALEVVRILSKPAPPSRRVGKSGSGGETGHPRANEDEIALDAPPLLTRVASDEAEDFRAASASLHARSVWMLQRRPHSEPNLCELQGAEHHRRRDGDRRVTRGEERGRGDGRLGDGGRAPSRGKVRFGDDQIREISPCAAEVPLPNTGLKKRSDAGRCAVQGPELWHEWSQQNQRLYARNAVLPAPQPDASSGAGMATSVMESATAVQQFNSWFQNEFEDLDEHDGADARALGAAPLHIVSNFASGVSGIAKLGSLSLSSLSLKTVASKVKSGMRPKDKWKKFGEERQRAY